MSTINRVGTGMQLTDTTGYWTVPNANNDAIQKIKITTTFSGVPSKNFSTNLQPSFYQTTIIQRIYAIILDNFFNDKIEKIRSKFHKSTGFSEHPDTKPKPFSRFHVITEQDVLRLIKSSLSKSYDLYPIPTSLVKECADILLTPIASIINKSLQEGKFPQCLKMAHVSPLLKSQTWIRII